MTVVSPVPRPPHRLISLLTLLLALLGGVILPLVGTPLAAQAATNAVVNDCSNYAGTNGLGAALTAANTSAGGTITFSCTSGNGTISIPATITVAAATSTPLVLDASTSTTLITLDGASSRQIFSVPSGTSLTISFLTLANGNGGSTSSGGLNNNGTTHVNNSTFRNNTSTGNGGALGNGQNATVTITTSTFTNNSTSAGGGAIVNNGGGTMTITNSTFTKNSSSNGGALIADIATTIITNSTFSSDTATMGNELTSNSGGTVQLKNSIISGTGNVSNCTGSGFFFDGGGNIQFGDSSCGSFFVGNPLLGPLAYNGGPTKTMALLSGSPAATRATTSCPATDQRGVTRGATCSSGAYEGTLALPTATLALSPTSIVAGQSSTMILTLNNNDATETLTGLTGSLALPAQLSYASSPTTTCSSGAPSTTGGTLNFTGGKLTANASCTVSVTVTGTRSGSYPMSPGSFSTDQTGSFTGPAVQTLTITPASASTLQVTVPGGGSHAGIPFSATVTALDTYGNVATGYTGTVRFTSSDTASGVVLPGNYTFVPATDNGQHTFVNGVTLQTRGSQTITATDTVTAAITGTATLFIGSATLSSIAVTPANPTIAKGTTQQFTAIGTFSDGTTQNLTSSVNWTAPTTGPGAATISNSAGSYGLATATTVGNGITITASLGTKTGSTTLTVSSATLQSIAVTPGTPVIAKGTTQTFVATGTFSDNSTQNLTGSATWSSGTTSVATQSGATATGIAPGTSTITATFGGKSGSTTLTVTAATLSSIAVTPATPTVAQGLTQQFTATGTFSDGSTQDLTSSVTWTSATPSVATISNAAGSYGLATALKTGTSMITASQGGIVSPGVTLTVTAPVLTGLTLSPATASVAVGKTDVFTVTGTYSDGSSAPVSSGLVWSSGTPSVATINSSGVATGVSAGSSLISAASGSITGSSTLVVTSATLTSITVSPASPSIAKGTTQQFTAIGAFSDSSTQDLTSSVTWTSATPSVATISNATTTHGVATGVASGTSSITASMSGITSSPVTLTVTAAPPLSTLAKTWYFAEGYSGPGFNVSYTVFNPGNTPATLNVIYYLDNGTTRTAAHIVGPAQPLTWFANADVGANVGFGARISSDQPVMAERTINFFFTPLGVTGASAVVGVNAPTTQWYFAEGYTGPGFSEYLTVINPDPAQATAVTLTYFTQNGSQTPKTFTIPAGWRQTIFVNDNTSPAPNQPLPLGVGPNQSVSVSLSSTRPIVAERPMYFTIANLNAGTGGPARIPGGMR